MAGNRIGFLVATGLLAVACNTGGTGATATPPATSSPPAATSGGTVTLDTANGPLGVYLVHEKAIYVFLQDGMNTSNCSGDCVSNWPPVVVGPGQTPTAGSGVTAQLATITRTDGSLQVTANGHPLYYFAGDSAAGDIKGQGIGGNWFLAAPDGSAVGATAASASPAPPATGTPRPTNDDYSGGYGDDY